MNQETETIANAVIHAEKGNPMAVCSNGHAFDVVESIRRFDGLVEMRRPRSLRACVLGVEQIPVGARCLACGRLTQIDDDVASQSLAIANSVS